MENTRANRRGSQSVKERWEEKGKLRGGETLYSHKAAGEPRPGALPGRALAQYS